MSTHCAIRPLALAAALAAIVAATPAGTAQPSLIRIATVEGVVGPVYYSLAEGRYRHIVPLDARGQAKPELVAENAL